MKPIEFNEIKNIKSAKHLDESDIKYGLFKKSPIIVGSKNLKKPDSIDLVNYVTDHGFIKFVGVCFEDKQYKGVKTIQFWIDKMNFFQTRKNQFPDLEYLDFSFFHGSITELEYAVGEIITNNPHLKTNPPRIDLPVNNHSYQLNINKIISNFKSVDEQVNKTPSSKEIKDIKEKAAVKNKKESLKDDNLGNLNSGFDLDKCIKNRPNLYSRNININLIIEYSAHFDSSYGEDDGYNRADFYDYVYGMLNNQPMIDAKDFTDNIPTLEGKETVLNNVCEVFEGEEDNIYSGVITFASTNILNYLKYEYDKNKDVYYIKGTKDIRSIGFLALGFGKEKLVICSNAFIKKNIHNIYIGPNVAAIEENAFPSLKESTISICEGVDYIAQNAFMISEFGLIRYGGKSIPKEWSDKWNQSKRTFYRVELGVKYLELSQNDIEEKITNYNKYSNVRWTDCGENNKDELFKSSKDDKTQTIKLLKIDGNYINQVSNDLRNDEDVILAAMNNGAWYFKYAGERLKRNKEFVARIAGNSFSGQNILEYVDSELLNDREYMISLIKTNEKCILHIGESLKNDKTFWLSVLKLDNDGIYITDFLEEAGKEVLNDIDVAKAAIEKNGITIKFFDTSIKKNKQLALEAIKRNGSAIGYVDPSLGLSDDINVVKMAIDSNPYSIRYASDRLKKNEDVALYAIKTNCSAIDVLHSSLLANKKFILKVMSSIDKLDRQFVYDIFMDTMDDSLKTDCYFMNSLRQLIE